MTREFSSERLAEAISSRRLVAEPVRRGRFLERACVGIPAPSLAQGIVKLAWSLDLADEEYIPLIMRLARESSFDAVKSLAFFPKIAWPLKDEK
jgi:hypothetical protein